MALGVQTLNLAVALVQSEYLLGGLQRDMHHMEPATAVVNKLAASMGMQAPGTVYVTESQLLAVVNTVLQVCHVASLILLCMLMMADAAVSKLAASMGMQASGTDPVIDSQLLAVVSTVLQISHAASHQECCA